MREPLVALGRVVELWRYPVKSLRGETVDTLRFTKRGVEGDRSWAVRGEDGKLGSGKTTRRFRRMPGLLTLRATSGDDGCPRIEFPAGPLRVDDPRCARGIGDIVGEAVTLVSDQGGAYVDAAPVHLVTTSTLAWISNLRGSARIDSRRFRPNLVIETSGDGRPEDEWADKILAAGNLRLRVLRPTVRCVMVTLGQADLGFAPSILRDLESRVEGCLGMYADVVEEGDLRLGDELTAAGDRPD